MYSKTDLDEASDQREQCDRLEWSLFSLNFEILLNQNFVVA